MIKVEEHKEEKQKKPKKRIKKVFLIIRIILLIIALITAYSYYAASRTVTAQLQIESGIVKVNGNIVNGNLKLSQGDIIETNDGLATVILYESIVINLNKNTKINLEELTQKHPQITQENGKTWNKFTKISGVETYTIKTGNTVASVRATGFEISDNKILTGDGKVEYTIDEKTFTVTAKRVVEKVNDEIIERDATKAELEEIKEYRQRTIAQLKLLRQNEIDKYKRFVDIVKSRYNITDEDIKQGFEAADRGEWDISEILKKSPVKAKPLKKIVEITKTIQQLNEELNQ